MLTLLSQPHHRDQTTKVQETKPDQCDRTCTEDLDPDSAGMMHSRKCLAYYRLHMVESFVNPVGGFCIGQAAVEITFSLNFYVVDEHSPFNIQETEV